MREIKFRGKKLGTGSWAYGFLAGIEELRIGRTGRIVSYDGENIHDSLVYADSVGQYTGLKDTKGKEIYEGDLLKSAFSKNVFGVITWNEKGYFCIIPLSVLKDEYSQDNDFATLGYMLEKKIDGRSCEFTVIGNIHDNPDLIV